MVLLHCRHQWPEVGQLGGLDAGNHVAAHLCALIFGRGCSRAFERAVDLGLVPFLAAHFASAGTIASGSGLPLPDGDSNSSRSIFAASRRV